MFKRYLLAALFVATGGFILCFATIGQAQRAQQIIAAPRTTPLTVPLQRGSALMFAKTPAARTFPAAASSKNGDPELLEKKEINPLNTVRARPNLPGASVDGILNSSAKARNGGHLPDIWNKAVPYVPTGGFNPHILLTFEGVAANGSAPPDTNAAVGPNDIVETVNLLVQVYDKNGNPRGPAFKQSDFYSMMPGSTCALTNDGDPVVLYDRLADRWVITQFGFLDFNTPPYHECIAVSKTGDPMGEYYAYDFQLPGNEFPDYPKFGNWPDAYYMTSNQFCAGGPFDGTGVFAFERKKMLEGDPTAAMLYASLTFQTGCNDSNPPVAPEGIFSMLPSDHSGLLPPPAGTPNSFIYFTNVLFGDPADGLRIFDFSINPGFGGGSFIEETSYASPLPLAAFDGRGPNGRDNIEQPPPAGNNGTDRLDAISERTMYPLHYNNRAGSETLVGNLTVNVSGVDPVDSTTYTAGFRYFELTRSCPTCPWTVQQQSTITVFDSFGAINSWIASTAMDNEGNIGFGFSGSDLFAVNPSLIYAGVSAAAPPDVSFVDFLWSGVGVQVGTSNRWGDYSSLELDPVDDCTFWHANEYYTSNNLTFNWQTRIGAFKLSDSCSPPPQGKLAGIITACNSGAPLSLAMVQISNGTSTTTQPANSGGYSLPLSPGSYTVTVIDPNRLCNQAGPFTVTVHAGQTTTLNACLTGVALPVVDPFDPTLEVVTGGNNNGIIDANECNNLTVTAKNIGCAPATHVVGTLTTSTPNVTITKPTANYLDMPIDASSANTTAFKVSTGPGFVCGTPIDFTLTLNFTGGSKANNFSVATCTETAAPVPFSGTLQTGDLIQQGRLGRNGPAGVTTCAGKPCPGPLSSGNRRYDLINFVNGPVDACVTISTSTSSDPSVTPILTKAHLGSYDPTDFCVNYLGDSSLVAATNYSFQAEVPANGTLVVVVEDSGNVAVTPATPSVPYTGLVSGLAAIPVPGPGICKIDTGITTVAGPKTHVGGSVFDQATLTTAVAGPPPQGTITFRLFGPNQATCGGALAFMSTVNVDGTGVYTSGSFTPTVDGTYRWIASYSGDANYNPISGLCNDANESEVVAPMATSITGSGTIASPFGGEASFDLTAQFKNGRHQSGKPVGNVDINDPQAGFRLTQVKLTSLSFVGDCAFITGTAKIGRTRVSFAVEACDLGSGPGTDFFAMKISNGYGVSGFIDSGDIKLMP